MLENNFSPSFLATLPHKFNMDKASRSLILSDKINLGNISDLQTEKYYQWVMHGKVPVVWFRLGGTHGINTMEE
jgi:hypothetical protein